MAVITMSPVTALMGSLCCHCFISRMTVSASAGDFVGVRRGRGSRTNGSAIKMGHSHGKLLWTSKEQRIVASKKGHNGHFWDMKTGILACITKLTFIIRKI